MTAYPSTSCFTGLSKTDWQI